MKIINVSPGLMPIPPLSWGAIEKIIWNIHQEFLARGLEAVITNDVPSVYQSEDIVLTHMANQSLQLHAQHIPYFFWANDHHVVLGGKQSHCYKQNLEAIQRSLHSFVSAKFLVDYFGESKVTYIPLGVDTKLFHTLGAPRTQRLLAVANTGHQFNPMHDRKGLTLAIDVARALNIPITVCGPAQGNKEFFSKHVFKDVNVNFVYDPTEQQLVDMMRTYYIFLHPSDLEGGHPNLTVLEALACGMPVVGTCFEKLGGMVQANNDLVSLINGVMQIMPMYNTYSHSAIREADRWSWANTVSHLLAHMKVVTSPVITPPPATMKQALADAYETTPIHVQPVREAKPEFSIHFLKGAFFEVKGGPEHEKYRVSFTNRQTNELVYQTILEPNHWGKASLEYFVDWLITVEDADTGAVLLRHFYDVTDKRVLIGIDSKALGDTIAWFSYIEEFRKKHLCHVIVSTFHNYLFKDYYPELEFVEPGTTVDHLYAQYEVGWFFDGDIPNKNKHPRDFRPLPLQQTSSDILGLPYVEVRPKILGNDTPNTPTHRVGIATQSTMQNKYWNYPDGWQELTNWLKAQYEVIIFSKEPDGYMGNRYPRGAERLISYDIKNVIAEMKKCDYFVGLSSGLTWLAWALDIPTYGICTIGSPGGELPDSVHKILPPKDKCQCCFTRYKFNPGKWDWCPDHQTDGRKFECSTSITADQVIDLISQRFPNEKKTKIQLIHLRTETMAKREKTSRESLKKLTQYGIDYKAMIHPISTNIPEDVKAFCRRPQDITDRNEPGQMVITPAHYGCYQAHRNALEAIDPESYDYTLICECDAVLNVSTNEFMEALNKVIAEIQKNPDIYYVNLGHSQPLGMSEEDKPYNDFLTENWYQILAHCYLVPNNKKYWYLERITDTEWDSGDL